MSTLNPGATKVRRVPEGGYPGAAPPETITIRWSVSRQALRAAKRAPAWAPSLGALGEHGPDLELCWKLWLEESRASAFIMEDPAGGETPLARALLRQSGDGGLLHIEAYEGSEVLLAATVRMASGASRVLYARTPLLARLGLGGGRYEVLTDLIA